MNKTSNNKIPFGLKNGTMVQVSDVESGLACGCICPSCKRTLQAKKGAKVAHYFSHDPSEEIKACESAFETSIHLMAKQILSEDGFSIVPGLNISISKSDANGISHVEEMSIETEVKKNFERVELEKRLEEIRPDIIAYTSEGLLLIEVAVTSFADRVKKKIIRDLGVPAIEIDLSSVVYTTTKEELRALLNDPSTKRKWLSNPKAISAKTELNAKLDEKLRLINERIYEARNKSEKQEIRRTIHSVPRIFHNETHVHRKPAKLYDPRWFICEACRHIFDVPVREAPYSIETIPCPACSYAVSAKS